MTVPYLMNCPHDGDGWCLSCVKVLGEEYEELRELIRHCWIHTAYRDCGFMQMTTEQKQLYCEIVGGTVEERIEGHRVADKRPCPECKGKVWDSIESWSIPCPVCGEKGRAR
jgi:hypothetical protein